MSETNNSLDPKLAAIISHFTLVGWFIAFLTRKEGQDNLFFYLRQTLGIHLISIALYWIPPFLFFGGTLRLIAGLGLLACWIISLLGALNEEQRRIPILGSFFQDQFKNL
jgi:uncharacterized membrane protein